MLILVQPECTVIYRHSRPAPVAVWWQAQKKFDWWGVRAM